MKKITKFNPLSVAALLAAVGLLLIPSAVFAATTSTSTSASTSTTTTQQQHLANIISRGNAEINRRLTTLNTLNSKISAAVHLTSSDKSYLTTEVNTEISGLTSLESTLDAETTITAARTDVQNIFNEYRVYALVAPKVVLVKTADDQQTVEANLTTLAQKLQTHINTASANGKNVTSLQNTLTNMNTETQNAQAISSSIEAKVLTLQPSDYNSDHTILSGDLGQLKTAHGDNQAAYSDAKTIVAGLKSL
jgi:hypothetical protein